MGEKQTVDVSIENEQTSFEEIGEEFEDVTVEVSDPMAVYNQITQPGEETFNEALEKEIQNSRDHEKVTISDATVDSAFDNFE